MGGNALKNYETRRLTKGEYEEFNVLFQGRFYYLFGFTPILILAYKEKESFGDADYLIDSSKLPPNWIERLKNGFDLTEAQYVKNSNVLSIGINNFQVDLIVTKPEELEIAEAYFSYNDFSNLIGRLGHKLGIKLGHSGIWVILRADKGHVLTEILLTRDYLVMLNILGLDPDVWKSGFNNLEQMFAYIATSKYFDPRIFDLEHRSANSRVRDKKRQTYRDFLMWVDRNKPIPNHDFANKSELGGYGIRQPYFDLEVVPRFPWVVQEIEKTLADFHLDQEFKKVWNGEIVNKVTGLVGKDLGQFMTKFKTKLDTRPKSYWIRNPQEVERLLFNSVLKEQPELEQLMLKEDNA